VEKSVENPLTECGKVCGFFGGKLSNRFPQILHRKMWKKNGIISLAIQGFFEFSTFSTAPTTTTAT
jgi:hypothetical protein